MSTVAVRDGVMAADRQGDYGDIPVQSTKLFNLSTCIVGFAGNLSDGLVFVEWLRKYQRDTPWPPPDFCQYRGEKDAPDFHALVMWPDGSVERWTEHFQPVPVEQGFFAIGSGYMAAMGAMVMGAGPERAVEVAAQCDIHTGREVMSYSHIDLQEAA